MIQKWHKYKNHTQNMAEWHYADQQNIFWDLGEQSCISQWMQNIALLSGLNLNYALHFNEWTCDYSWMPHQ